VSGALAARRGAGGESAPQESVGLAFTWIDVEYRPIEANGALGAPISAGWDLSTHAEV
jgi:type VI protein secretion system component Hcp